MDKGSDHTKNFDDRELEDVVSDSGCEGAGSDVVYVFANLHSGQRFMLPASAACPGGACVSINGMPVSRLKDLDGRSFAGGYYGVTRVAADLWEQVMKIYGTMKIFSNGLVFAAPSMRRGKAIVRERRDLRHSFEPLDPESNRAKTRPALDESRETLSTFSGGV